MGKKHIETSKFLSYVLRHHPESVGLSLDGEGWADVDVLIEGAQRLGKRLNKALIREVVAENDKKRFALSEDGLRIRAVQGHSTKTVALTYEEKEPSVFLYHGTATRFLEAIMREGLKAGSRHHVHLSADKKTAIAVGTRYGMPAVLRIDTVRMREQGRAFFLAENGVWLTERVPADCLAVEPKTTWDCE